jgi:hypothetical protein
LPNSIVAVAPRGVNGLWPLEPTASVGMSPLERGDRAGRKNGDHADQCAACARAGAEIAGGVSALAGVVSGCSQKSGNKRQELAVATGFAPLLRWIGRLWEPGQRQLALVRDATSLGERWTVLSICVVIRSCAIPVAWKGLRGHEPGSWRPHWEGLLSHLQGGIPADWQVVVLADRGLYARWLFQAICACGWHPLLRINLGVKARAGGEETFDWISRWTPRPGTHWQGRVECFAGKASRLTCSLLLHWGAGYTPPWAVLTDLEPAQAQVSGDGRRSWAEPGYTDGQRGRWGWHPSNMPTASCVERRWLAMAVAQLWTVSVGCQLEAAAQQASCGTHVPTPPCARQRRQRPADQPPPRRLRCVVRGRRSLLAALLQAHSLPCGQLVPQAWPQSIAPPRKLPRLSQQRERQRKREQKRRARGRARPAA